MGIKKYLDSQPLQLLEKYNTKEHYRDTCVNFDGSPRKHPYDPEKILLVCDPFSENTTIYEFNLEDIKGVEDLANLGTKRGENLKMVRLWIKKQSFGLSLEPFQVDEPLRYFHGPDKFAGNKKLS